MAAVLKLKHTSERHQESLFRLLDAIPRVSDSVSLDLGLRMCIFNKFLGNAAAATGWGTIL